MEIHELLELYEKDLKSGIVSDVCGEEIYKYLISATRFDVAGIRMLLFRLYKYLLKYKYQKESQSIFWIEIIRMASMDLSINLEDKYLEDKITISMQREVYLQTVRAVVIEIGIDQEVLPQALPEEFCLKNISDYGAIHHYLRRYAYCEHVKKELNIES